MRGLKMTFVILLCVIEAACSELDPTKDEYKRYPGKRLSNVIKTVMTSSKLGCMMLCSTTNGCLAVNIISNHDTTCELTTGLSDDNEMQDDHNSQLFVLDYNKCKKEPGFCLNAATYEPIWTSARCQCSDRFQGDDCGECTEWFQGEDCDECADGYYGNSCEISFTSHPGKSCNAQIHDFNIGPTMMADNSGYYDNCKKWFVARDDCDGFVFGSGACYFANEH